MFSRHRKAGPNSNVINNNESLQELYRIFKSCEIADPQLKLLAKDPIFEIGTDLYVSCLFLAHYSLNSKIRDNAFKIICYIKNS